MYVYIRHNHTLSNKRTHTYKLDSLRQRAWYRSLCNLNIRSMPLCRHKPTSEGGAIITRRAPRAATCHGHPFARTYHVRAFLTCASPERFGIIAFFSLLKYKYNTVYCIYYLLRRTYRDWYYRRFIFDCFE